ncbi:MAG: thioesterase family protein [Pseudomonadota bacterium]
MRFCERGRTEYLRVLGISQSALFDLPEAERRSFVVRSMVCEFRKTAKVDDILTVSTKIIDQKRASLTMRQAVMRRKDTIFTADVRIACLNAEGRPARLPGALKASVNPA